MKTPAAPEGPQEARPPPSRAQRLRATRDFRAARSSGPPSDPDGARLAILNAAADVFRDQGFAAASIDAVAARLKATKGLVYHYYRSKADLFFDVCLTGMALDFSAVEPMTRLRERPITRLKRMAVAHVTAMLAHGAFQHVILQGITGHRTGTFLADDAAAAERLLNERARYAELFRSVLSEAARDGDMAAPRDCDVTLANFLAVLYAPLSQPRTESDEAARARIAEETAYFALRGAGAIPDVLDEEFER